MVNRRTMAAGHCVYFTLVGKGLSNDDGDVNEKGKKAIGLNWQNNNFARASYFFVCFFFSVMRVAFALQKKTEHHLPLNLTK